MHLALALGAQERWVDQDEAAESPLTSARRHGGGHAPHRVADQNGTREIDATDETHDVAREIVVPVPVVRRARTAMPSCIGHDHVELALERACELSPASAASH